MAAQLIDFLGGLQGYLGNDFVIYPSASRDTLVIRHKTIDAEIEVTKTLIAMVKDPRELIVDISRKIMQKVGERDFEDRMSKMAKPPSLNKSYMDSDIPMEYFNPRQNSTATGMRLLQEEAGVKYRQMQEMMIEQMRLNVNPPMIMIPQDRIAINDKPKQKIKPKPEVAPEPKPRKIKLEE